MQLLQQVATAAGKGQLITKLLFGVLNFPKNQLKNLMNFCLESTSWLNWKNKGPFIYQSCQIALIYLIFFVVFLENGKEIKKSF